MKAVKYYFNELMENVSAFGSIFIHILLMAVAFALKDVVLYPLLKGFVLIYLIGVPIKLLVFKNRPKKMKYKEIWEKFEASSFPSIHAARVVFLALVLCSRFNNNALSAVLFAVAALVMYSRIYLKKHYWGDVIGGLLIGIVIYYLSFIL